MLDYVIDANILVNILISGKSSYLPLLDYFRFITPEYSLIELDKYQEVIFSKSKLDDTQFRTFAYNVFSKITILPAFLLT